MSFLTDEDRNTYNDIRPVFIGVCPECGAEIDQTDYMMHLNDDRTCDLYWRCDCGFAITPDIAYTI